MFALMQSRVGQKASVISKARTFFKDKLSNKKDRSEPDFANPHAVKDMCSQFAETKSELLMRFGADDEKSAFTMVVWDFGGQRVRFVLRISANAIAE